MTGTDSKIVAFLPLVLLIALVVGVVVADSGVGDDPDDVLRRELADPAPDGELTAPAGDVAAALARPE